tara:strand:- start:385 stop:750 length:366 start_codon:yes stop_codon:yes gene_type:complete
MFDFLKRHKDEKEGEGKFPAEEPFPEQPFPDAGGGVPPLPSTPMGSPAPQGQDLPLGQDMPPPNPEAFGSMSKPRVVEPPKAEGNNKEELILAKLDNMRTMLDVINQRLVTLEQKSEHKRW